MKGCLNSDMISYDQPGKAQHQSERGWREQGFFLKDAIDQDDHQPKCCKALGKDSGARIQAPCLERDRKAKAKRYKSRDTHLVKHHAYRTFDSAVEGSCLLRCTPVDREIALRQVSADPQPATEWVSEEPVPATHEADGMIIADL